MVYCGISSQWDYNRWFSISGYKLSQTKQNNHNGNGYTTPINDRYIYCKSKLWEFCSPMNWAIVCSRAGVERI